MCTETAKSLYVVICSPLWKQLERDDRSNSHRLKGFKYCFQVR
ncbi:hypothetical protein NC651_021551 [Populus alba x Populus x berolinensis]|nr:hypothetical protein NC651_021551 [Populus alba x Populus x berolinensis]